MPNVYNSCLLGKQFYCQIASNTINSLNCCKFWTIKNVSLVLIILIQDYCEQGVHFWLLLLPQRYETVVPLFVDFHLKYRMQVRNLKNKITGRNTHKFGIWWLREQGKLSPIKLTKMTKSCLFLPIIDITMIRNAPQDAAITRIELMILKRKCYCKVTIFNGSASSTYLP